jgi:hypothetical protein
MTVGDSYALSHAISMKLGLRTLEHELAKSGFSVPWLDKSSLKTANSGLSN